MSLALLKLSECSAVVILFAGGQRAFLNICLFLVRQFLYCVQDATFETHSTLGLQAEGSSTRRHHVEYESLRSLQSFWAVIPKDYTCEATLIMFCISGLHDTDRSSAHPV